MTVSFPSFSFAAGIRLSICTCRVGENWGKGLRARRNSRGAMEAATSPAAPLLPPPQPRPLQCRPLAGSLPYRPAQLSTAQRSLRCTAGKKKGRKASADPWTPELQAQVAAVLQAAMRPQGEGAPKLKLPQVPGARGPWRAPYIVVLRCSVALLCLCLVTTRMQGGCCRPGRISSRGLGCLHMPGSKRRNSARVLWPARSPETATEVNLSPSYTPPAPASFIFSRSCASLPTRC